MARKPATAAQRQAARRHIQKAAASVYAEQGAAGVSVRAIALRAEVSVGTIYAHFGSLQGLMQSLWMEPVETINAQLVELAAGIADPAARLRALLTTYVDVARTRPELFRGAFLFVRPDTLPKPPRGPLEEAPFAALLIAAVADGQAAGLFRQGDPRRLAQIAWAGVHGGLALPVNFDRLAFAPPDQLASDMIDMVLADLSAAPVRPTKPGEPGGADQPE